MDFSEKEWNKIREHITTGVLVPDVQRMAEDMIRLSELDKGPVVSFAAFKPDKDPSKCIDGEVWHKLPEKARECLSEQGFYPSCYIVEM